MAKKKIQAKKQLLSILKKNSFKQKRVILSSGKSSNFYFDGRISSLMSSGAYLMAEIILDMIKNERVDAIGGLTLGADPIIGATVALSFKKKQADKRLHSKKRRKKTRHEKKDRRTGFEKIKQSSNNRRCCYYRFIHNSGD